MATNSILHGEKYKGCHEDADGKIVCDTCGKAMAVLDSIIDGDESRVFVLLCENWHKMMVEDKIRKLS